MALAGKPAKAVTTNYCGSGREGLLAIAVEGGVYRDSHGLCV